MNSLMPVASVGSFPGGGNRAMHTITVQHSVCAYRVAQIGQSRKFSTGKTVDHNFKELEFSKTCFALHLNQTQVFSSHLRISHFFEISLHAHQLSGYMVQSNRTFRTNSNPPVNDSRGQQHLDYCHINIFKIHTRVQQIGFTLLFCNFLI